MNCNHVWIVFSTAMVLPTIMVECAECGALGGVLDHTQEEWNLAYHAPSMPFRWADDSRVILQDDLPEPTPEDWQRLREFFPNLANVDVSLRKTDRGAALDRLAGLVDELDLFDPGDEGIPF